MSWKAMDGTIVRAEIKGQEISFFVNNAQDVIQRHHRRGQFYERRGLQIIAEHFPPDGVFLDVGANVGNHTIYVAKFLRPRSVIVVELTPPAIFILRSNIALNNLGGVVDASLLGVGFADVEGRVVGRGPKHNLGNAVFTLDSEGSLRVVPGDSLLADRRIDFVKIDVEGMEMAVLKGLEQTIARNRPALYVEVDDRNAEDFRQWLGANRYRLSKSFRYYETNENFMVMPE
jgi:FkbM family methyltransferase